MNALITGANGFVGAWLARRLVENGHAVRCLVRRTADASSLDGVGVERVQGDVNAPQSLAAAVSGCEVVFHLAGIRRAPAREAFFRVNAEGTRSVCDAMVRAGCRRLVLCSSLAASGPASTGAPRREEDPLQPAEWYGESKAEAERIAFSFEGRLEVTASRPSRIIGPGDKENLAFFKLVKRGYKLVIGGGPRPLSVVDVEDVVDLLVLLAQSPQARGEAFFSTGEVLTLDQLLDAVAVQLGVTPRAIHVSPAALRALAWVADGVSRATGKHLPLNRKLARQLLVPAWTCSSEKAERVLGYRASRSIDGSLRRTLDWYTREGWL